MLPRGIELSIQLLDILTPLFKEMEDHATKLTESQFSSSMQNLYDTLSVPDKEAIIDFGKKRPRPTAESKFSFKVSFSTSSQ